METEIIERKAREFEELTDLQRIKTLFERFLNNVEMKGKDHRRNAYFRGKVGSLSNDVITFQMEIHSATLLKDTEITLTRFVGRFIHIEGTIVGAAPNHIFIIRIDSIKLAKKARISSRINPGPDVVYASNFKVVRAAISVDSMNIPTFIKITFSDYENKLLKKFDKIKIDIFRPANEEKFHLVQSTGKAIFIKDTQDPKSYLPFNEEEFLNCEEEFFEDIEDVIKEYKQKKITSEIIMPIIILNGLEDVSPIGYVHIQSHTKKIEFEDLMEAKMLTFEMIDRIRESNTMLYKQKVEVLNISAEGIRIKLVEPEIKQQIQHVGGFNMDIIFKMQTPINVSVIIRNILKDSSGNHYIGLEIDGFRQSDKERYLDNIFALSRPTK
ncbi:MAG: DUF1577 domain-containing protein [Spirochaetia bacterium]|nr:DUF1577 domain-containing protein [Spirochaetia bacterium]